MISGEHGKLTPCRSGRYCDKHGQHGFLYLCSEYSEDLQNEIEYLGHEFRQRLRNGSVQVKEAYSTRIEGQNEFV